MLFSDLKYNLQKKVSKQIVFFFLNPNLRLSQKILLAGWFKKTNEKALLLP